MKPPLPTTVRSKSRHDRRDLPGGLADCLATLTPAMKAALRLLLQADETAAKLGVDSWVFAIEIQALCDSGLNFNELRSLLCQGLADHLVERTSPGATSRMFHPPHNLRLQTTSCFVISEMGRLLAVELLHQTTLPQPTCQPSMIHLHETPAANQSASVIPFWDRDRRELRFGDVIVKRFRQPARNQETILAAFQEDGWPARIDNPLAGNQRTTASDRLHDGVKKLNRQNPRYIRFLSDGAGLGVIWQVANESDP